MSIALGAGFRPPPSQVYIYICTYVYSPSLFCQRWIPPKCGVSRLELELLKFEDHQNLAVLGVLFIIYIK